MALIVQKYGGTSMGTPERILNVARRVKRWHDHGHKVVVVVSAMSGETNRLLALAKAITETPDPRELDQMVSTGEQVTISMLAMALNSIGVEAKSLTGRQVGIKTDSAFTKARIESIDTDVLTENLDAGRVIVVAGFQGFDADGNTTTLGRGGSDTSGVALAAALKRMNVRFTQMLMAYIRLTLVLLLKRKSRPYLFRRNAGNGIFRF